MPFGTGGEFAGGGGGGTGGGGGAVNSVSAGDLSVLIPTTTGTVTVTTNTLDHIATAEPPAGNWSNNSHKITGLANGTVSSDAAAFGQIPTTTSLPYTVNVVSTSQTMNANQVYVATGTISLTLPSYTTGQWNIVKYRGTGTLTLVGTIDGTTNPTITTQYQSDTIVNDGTNNNFI